MKLAGALLLLGGAAWWTLLRRREGMEPVETARALLEDLAVLRCQIEVCRTPMPELLRDMLSTGPGGALLWKPLGDMLAREGAYLPDCWREAVGALPPPLNRMLAPIGPLLPEGGEALGEAVEETREELARFLQEETARQLEHSRVTAALCLAGASLVILVLL